MTAKQEISLLPEAENPNSLSSRLFHWITTTGRFVIVFTELIVIMAFISRFTLDRKNADLSEIIRQQEAILKSTQNFEKDFLSLQQKLKTIKTFYTSQPNYDKKIATLIESTPSDLIYDNLSISQDSKTKEVLSTLNLTAYREESIIDYIANLMVNSNIKTVDITKIEKKPRENKYSLTVSLIFNSKDDL